MKQRSRIRFERWAGAYDRSVLNHLLFRPAYVTMMEEIARWRRETSTDGPFDVLDVGCGTGTLAGLLASSPWPVRTSGIDYSLKMCAASQAKARALQLTDSVRFVNADSELLPFADESFDIVGCSNSFHHYPHQERVVAEMHRVLRPGGRLILIDGFRDCVIGWVVYDVVVARIEKNVHHATWQTIDGYFRKAGFENVRRRKFGFWFPLCATIGVKR